MAAKKTKASGRNIPEADRGTERLNLRLDAEAMELLRFYAKAWRCPMSEVVHVALEALKNDKLLGQAGVS